ncbi:MAG: M24 family metallopeptidase [Pseudobdellovibrionaceae bacterium]
MKIFTDSVLKSRRLRLEKAMNSHLEAQDWVFIFSGEPIQKPGGLDQTYPFIPHPEYLWLSGLYRPQGLLAYNKDLGWKDFVLPLTPEERLWEGGGEEFAGEDIQSFNGWFEKQKCKRLFLYGQPSPAQKTWATHVDPTTHLNFQEVINSVRRQKDEAEIQLIQKAAQMAHQGYQKLQSFIRPGVSEREIQIEFESTVMKAGSEKFPYTSIVGSGPRSAVLHALPTDRKLQPGEMVLIDAGADLFDYCVDITRVFPASGKFSSQQKEIYDLVFQAQKTSISLCTMGREWHDVHRASAEIIANGLKELKILKGETDSLLESGAISVFFPHGVGHMVGLKVRDVGANPLKPPRMSCGVRVRVDFPLQENFVMTVEPGLYFVDALLERKETRQKFSQMIDWNEVEKWRGFGGIRLEDDILITSQGPENLTGFIEK